MYIVGDEESQGWIVVFELRLARVLIASFWALAGVVVVVAQAKEAVICLLLGHTATRLMFTSNDAVFGRVLLILFLYDDDSLWFKSRGKEVEFP